MMENYENTAYKSAAKRVIEMIKRQSAEPIPDSALQLLEVLIVKFYEQNYGSYNDGDV